MNTSEIQFNPDTEINSIYGIPEGCLAACFYELFTLIDPEAHTYDSPGGLIATEEGIEQANETFEKLTIEEQVPLIQGIYYTLLEEHNSGE